MPSGPSFPLALFLPFQASPPQTLLVRGARATGLVSNPITEITIIPLIEHLTEDDVAAVTNDSTAFGDMLLTTPAPMPCSGTMALTYTSGWAAGAVKNRLVMMIGWRDVQNHIDATKTAIFEDSLKPIFEKVAGELRIRHFHLQVI